MLRRRFAIETAEGGIAGLSIVLFLLWTATSWARWANFAYRTFDLAYYVQALWQLIHGRLEVSVQYVPLLGNHVEPIMFLFAPFFFCVRHPMLFVVLQNAALAAMGPVGFAIARRLGLSTRDALCLGAATLLAPATGYVALHEFHPEALTAPFLLLMWQARLAGSLRRHWLWFLAVLACKENMALLLTAYCAVQWACERKRGGAQVRAWFIWPAMVAIVWFVVCSKVITPAFNSGNIDYLALYERLGGSAGDILRNAITKPQLIFAALSHSLRHGNLLWGVLLPFLGLPLLKPKWLLILIPVLLQHLLSWRASEWTIYFHYGAPLVSFCWLAAVEAIAGLTVRGKLLRTAARVLPVLIFLACLSGQFLLGPMRGIVATGHDWIVGKNERARKQAFLANIPKEASVVAPLPYLSHLAMRRELHSLHYILKGLKTLSRAAFTAPPPTDYVLVDYSDGATFDAGAGFYHPQMRVLGGRIIPSSEKLLNEFLRRASWESRSVDELTLLKRREQASVSSISTESAIAAFTTETKLIRIEKSAEVISTNEALEIRTTWEFGDSREVFPWMVVQFIEASRGARIVLLRGMCAPDAGVGAYEDKWHIREGAIPPGHYRAEALFFDNAKAAWGPGKLSEQVPLLAPPMPLGDISVEPAGSVH